MPSIRLHRQVCAFIDVLGGAKLFRGKDRGRAADFFDLIKEFERRLNKWSHNFPEKRQAQALVKTFSDNIFVAFPLGSSNKASDEEVVGLFLGELVIQVQQMTCLGGFPHRGGVSVGGLMFTDKFLFGPALVDAALLEKKAVFPRILLGKSVLRYISPDSPQPHLILRDADGQDFLHYLGDSGVHLRQHRLYVQQGLQKNSSHVHERQKYEWLAQYRNYCAHCVGAHEIVVSPDRVGAFTSLHKGVNAL